MSEMSAPSAAPREVVIASAGAGKTFHISSKIIALLAHDEPVESILASTFTRKAAGQILEKVLERIAEAALDEETAKALSGFATLSAGNPLPTDTSFWQGHLERLVRALHRTNVGTLDAFFVGVARTFAHELGLPPGWGIADEPTMRRIRSEALQDVLAGADTGEVVELLRLVNRGEIRRSIHDHLLGELDDILTIHDQLDPRVANPWGRFGEVTSAPPPTTSERETLAQIFEALPVPTTKSGSPRRHWSNALAAAPADIRSGDWEAFIGNGICKKVIAGETQYDREEIASSICDLVEEGLDLARRALRPELARQVEALGRLADDFAAAYRERQAREGVYRFDDVTRMVADDEHSLGARADLHYRLDARIRHLLLDEFQDTSLAQWEALSPLIEEVLSDPGNRAGVVVADPKQSIYGWRGGEPEIVHRVADHYRLDPRSLSMSWRSSPIVLDLVNRLFEGILEVPTIQSDEAWAEAAKRWHRDFKKHTAASPNSDLPGYVEVEVGPREDGRGGKAEPLMCRFAAQRVEELHRAAPDASIVVLTRTNPTVTRMIMELKELAVDASEEGGTPLTDSAGCEAVLALLHLADHPGDGIARYHVARSPLGEAIRFTDPADRQGATRLALNVRRDLAENGYGTTVERWIEKIHASCDRRELRRLAQLAELAHRYDERATLRPSDFVRLIESERVEDPTPARVRVMTVHQAKGLEFDIVVLPELDGTIAKTGRLPAFPYRPEPTARVTDVLPAPTAAVRELFPEIEVAHAQARASTLRDGLSTFYVALTRARHALHLILRADGERGPGSAKTPARILREALADDPGALTPIAEGEVIYQAGDPDWHKKVTDSEPASSRNGQAAISAEQITLATPARRSRLLPRRSPSALEGGEEIQVRDVLRLDAGGAFARGSLVHAWFELIEWLEEGVPDEATLLTTASRIAPQMASGDIEETLSSFRRCLESSDIRRLLSRASYSERAEVLSERTFIHRETDFVMEGAIDRLVIESENGRVSRAEIIDFKTDAVADEDSLQRRIAFYRPQMRAYWRAVQTLYHLPPENVTVKLVFMQRGEVVGMEFG